MDPKPSTGITCKMDDYIDQLDLHLDESNPVDRKMKRAIIFHIERLLHKAHGSDFLSLVSYHSDLTGEWGFCNQDDFQKIQKRMIYDIMPSYEDITTSASSDEDEEDKDEEEEDEDEDEIVEDGDKEDDDTDAVATCSGNGVGVPTFLFGKEVDIATSFPNLEVANSNSTCPQGLLCSDSKCELYHDLFDK